MEPLLNGFSKPSVKTMPLSENYFKNLFFKAGIGMAITDVTGKFLKINQACENLLGYSEQELLQLDIGRIIPPEDYLQLNSDIQKLVTGAALAITTEKRCRKKNQEIVWLRFNISLETDAADIPQGLIIIFQNITHEKKAQESLQLSEKRFRSLSETSPDVITRHDKNFKYLYANPQIEKYLGIKPEEFLGKSYRELGMPESICSFYDTHLAMVFETKEFHSVEFEMPGTDMYIQSRLVPEFNEEGEVVSVLVLSTEISERRKKDEELQRLLSHLQLATESAHVATWWYDVKSEKLEWSGLHKKMWGYDENRNDLYFKNWYDLIHPNDKQNTLDILEKASGGSSIYDAQYRIVRISDGAMRWMRSFGQYQYDSDRHPRTLTGVTLDITEQKEAEERFRKTEERFRGTFENAAVGIAHVALDGTWLMVNNRLCEIVGYDQRELLQHRFQDITHKDDLDADLKQVQQLIEGKIPTYSLEKRYINKRGDTVWVNLTVSMARDREQRPEYFISIIQDINERKRAEQALQQSNERFKLINKATQDAVWDWDLVTNELYWNETVYTLFNYRPEEVAHTIDWWYQHVHSDDRERVVNGIHQAIDNGESSWWDEYQYECGDGSFKTVYDRGFILHNEDGKPLRMLGSMQDITERKQYLLSLKENEERFRTLANSISQLAWIANAEGWIYWYNQRWYDYTGTTLEEMQGWGWQKVHHPDYVDSVVTFAQKAWTEEEAFELTFPLRRKDGIYRWFLTQTYPVKNSQGHIVQWIGTNTDIHDQKTFTEKLEGLVAERTRELQRSNEDLQQFAHVASHDLKEPVRKIQTFSSRLENELKAIGTEKSKNYLHKIQNSAERMSQMIEGVLAYSTLNASEEQSQVINLNDVIKNIEGDLEVAIHQKQATIKNDVLPNIEGSEILIYQLFYNLINNSLKFSQPNVPPLISITCQVPDDKGNDAVKIIVSDNGIGFEQEYADHIFNSFTRLNSRDKFEGTGLGLALCKKIVERHKGTIQASGYVNRGASFTIAFPMRQISRQ
jgi:hypothetical protein